MSLHTDNLRNVFQDNDEDDDNDIVLNYMADNARRTKPHETTDLSRLTGDAGLNCFIMTNELTYDIRSIKTTCPDMNIINKTTVSHLPEDALNRLRKICNSVLFTGHFRGRFKEAEMRMIAKPGKDPTRPDSFRLISFLDPRESLSGKAP